MDSILLKEKKVILLEKLIQSGKYPNGITYKEDSMFYRVLPLMPYQHQLRSEIEREITSFHDHPIGCLTPPIYALRPEKEEVLLGFTDRPFLGYTFIDTFYLGYKPLKSLVSKNASGKYNYDQRREVCDKLINTVEEIESRGYVHSNINSSTIVIKGKDVMLKGIDSMQKNQPDELDEDIEFDTLFMPEAYHKNLVMKTNLMQQVFDYMFDIQLDYVSTISLMEEFGYDNHAKKEDVVVCNYLDKWMFNLISSGWNMKELFEEITQQKVLKLRKHLNSDE